MSNTALHTDKAPAAIGPYSQGIQAGNTIYVSGQIPIDPATGEFAGQDIKTQTRQSLTRHPQRRTGRDRVRGREGLITNPKRQNAPLRKKLWGNLRFCIDNSVCAVV